MKKIIIIFLFIFLGPCALNAYTAFDTAKSVIKSLKTQPENWRHDQHRLYYFKDVRKFETIAPSRWDDESDCVIWIANGDYAIEIQSPQRVKFQNETQIVIWDIYQKWANGYFAEVFDDLETSPEVMAEPSEEIKEEKFIDLVTDNIKVEKRPNDFFSNISKSTRIFLTVIAITSVVGVFSFIIFNLYRTRKTKDE